MPEITRPTVMLHYDEMGGDEPALVFLHGWCDGSETWSDTMAAFAGRHRCIAPDMRGHGRSGMPRDHCFSAEALSNDVVAICEQMGITRPVIIGHSYGGYVAAELARRLPGFARAIVIVDQPLDLRGFATQMRALEGVIRSAETHMAFRAQFMGSMVSDAMPAESRAVVERIVAETPAEVGQALWAALFEFTPEEIAERSIALMKWLDGQAALNVAAQAQPDYEATLARYAPNVRTKVIEGGHWIHLEHPEEFRATVRGFIRKIEA